MPSLPPDGHIRPETMAALAPVGAFGVPLLKRMGPYPFLAVAIKAGIPTRVVPEDYWRDATDLENHAQAVIDCPCGQLVIVELARDLKPCPGCKRWFFYSGPAVFALNTSSP
jgi:hypothetical protein